MVVFSSRVVYDYRQDVREGVMLQDVKCQVRRMRGGGFELFGGKFLLEVIINIWGTIIYNISARGGMVPA